MAVITIALGCGAGCSSASGTQDAGNGTAGKAVVINEAFPNGTSVSDPDWVELKNLTGAAVDLSGYRVRDQALADLFALPGGASIDAGGYLVIYADDQADGGVDGGVHVPWKLSSKKGDEVHLLDRSGTEIDSTIFGTDVPADKSWGRLPDGTGSFVRTTPTEGKANL